MNQTFRSLLVALAATVICARATEAAEMRPRLSPHPADSVPNQRLRTTVPSVPWRSLIVKPDPKLKGRIHFYDKLNPVWWVGNLVEPVAPDWYRPHDRNRNLKYHLRNPGANFARFVIGISDHRFVRSGRYPELMANPHGGLNFALSRRNLLVLPFIDYRFKKFEVYFGWRDHGSFGVAFRRQTRLHLPDETHGKQVG